MLDPWIIEEIRKREEQDQRDDRPELEISDENPNEHRDPSSVYGEKGAEEDREDPEIERGVFIVDF